ncbi:MAG: NAD+ synthase [Coxiellaceae bacterium]|nr:NAD+ synthase [Coxiellaceae bacterium]
MSQLTLTLAQINPTVGAIESNTQQVIACCHQAVQNNSDIIIFPELVLTGYPPEDLLYRDELYQRVEIALQSICQQQLAITIVVGHPAKQADIMVNQASVIQNGEIIARYNKQHLPNYNVFDEKRYFNAGNQPCIISVNDVRIAITICEDLWWPGPAQQAQKAGAQLIVSLNASPFHRRQAEHRIEVLTALAQQVHLPIAYVNMVGGQDELVFDGGSLITNRNGEVCEHAPYFETDTLQATLDFNVTPSIKPNNGVISCNDLALIYQALVLGLKDYIIKNGFKNVILGLSGGIDSALTLAIAVDALGAEHVEAISMPSQYTVDMSNEDAAEECELLQVKYQQIAISPIYEAFIQQLAPAFEGRDNDITEENLQARCRGMILMALSNKLGSLVLSTGNKSELAVGFATLYGDMCGGFAVLKDVPKTLVYQLAEYRNKLSPAIPQRVIDRPPTAELANDQLDQDRLPPYDILDAIIERFIECDQSAKDIIAAGFDKQTIYDVIKLIKRNEYKRSQAAIGTRITQRAFGKDRRYPLTHELF